jgi:hypothetical protein
MFSQLRFRRPKHGTVVAYLALFIALGGTSYAVTRINGSALKDRSVAGKKLKKNTVTGVEIKESKLGKVPTALNASQLAGQPPSTYKTRCPASMQSTPGFCFEPSSRTPAKWVDAVTTCATAGWRLPTTGELAIVFEQVGGSHSSEWTTSIFRNGTSDDGALLNSGFAGQIGFGSTPLANPAAYRCVTSPSD